MFKPKTIIAVLFSLLMGILAVKGVSFMQKDRPAPPPPKAAVPAAPEVKSRPEPMAFSDNIPTGMRIATIKVNEVSGVTRLLKRGDRVDVVAVSKIRGNTSGTLARIVLQDIEIFSFEEGADNRHLVEKVSSKKKREWTVHLLVTPDQGAVISTVDSGESLRLLLRNSGDREILADRPRVYSSQSGLISVNDAGSYPASPASGIRPGMRAITLKMADSDGICGTLSPGDRVDVIFSCEASRFSTQGAGQAVGTKGEIVEARKSSKILVQNVEVLTSETALNSVIGSNSPVASISLMVTPKQAETLSVAAYASKTGKLKLIARNRTDQTRVATSGEILEDLLLKDRKPYKLIQVLKGTKAREEKFYVR